MKQYLVIILALSIGFSKFQNLTTETLSDNCNCIDGFFSTSTKKPIATADHNGRSFSFCGYSSEATKYRRDYGLLRPDTSFLLCGFELIDCETQTSIFSEGEYYTDSVKLTYDGFELYRLTRLPNPNGGTYISVPAVQFNIIRDGNSFTTDTVLAIPESFYQSDYLMAIEKNLTSLKQDSSKQMEAADLELSYLFLRALQSDENKTAFYDNAPRDGYMGPIFTDYKLYLILKERL